MTIGHWVNISGNGRFVLPLEYRKRLNIENGGRVAIEYDADRNAVVLMSLLDKLAAFRGGLTNTDDEL